MFCRYCGASIPEDSLFCSKCGKSLAQRETLPPQNPVQRETPPVESYQQREKQPPIDRPSPRQQLPIETPVFHEHPAFENLEQYGHSSAPSIGERENTRAAKLFRTLRLNTPYPYAALLILLAVIWVNMPRKSTYDYSQMKWSIEMEKQSDVPEDHSYQDSLSLVVENMGTKTIKGIPIEIHASIEPQKPADVEAAFPGDRETIMTAGKAQPVALVLGDSILAGGKRRYSFDENVKAKRPFKVTLEVRENDARTVLTKYVLER